MYVSKRIALVIEEGGGMVGRGVEASAGGYRARLGAMHSMSLWLPRYAFNWSDEREEFFL